MNRTILALVALALVAAPALLVPTASARPPCDYLEPPCPPTSCLPNVRACEPTCVYYPDTGEIRCWWS
jgi:hypothetical protein